MSFVNQNSRSMPAMQQVHVRAHARRFVIRKHMRLVAVL
jgi:hypothetical protein